MVAAQHKLSRREVLAAACAVPVLPLSRHSGRDPESTFLPDGEKDSWIPDQVRNDEEERRGEKWAKALARCARAEAGVEAAGRGDDDDLYDRALGRFNSALARLLRAPAPDLGALAEKLDLIMRHSVFELSFGEAALEALRRDVRGMAGLPSRLCDFA